jgi:hypothetical protein
VTPVRGPSRKHDLPWFPFDAEEFLSTSAFILMSLEERGAYITLCSWQWLEGYLPGEEKDLARLLNLGVRDFRRVWKSLGPLFPMLLDGTRQNPVIADARTHQKWKRERLREAGRRGGKKKPTFTKEGEARLQGTLKQIVSYSPSIEERSNQTKEKKKRISESAVLRIFGYWEEKRAETLGIERRVPMKATDKRLGKIRARMGEGYGEDDLKRAVDGCMGSDFNVKGGHVDIELICRDQSHVERYMGMAPRDETGGQHDHLA